MRSNHLTYFAGIWYNFIYFDDLSGVGELMSTTILFTSLKGGCGTSTACANIAASFAKMNKRVLLLSLNRYCCSVDMMFGMESAFVLDITDFPESSIEDICLPVNGFDSLYMAVRSPFSEENDGHSEVAFIEAASESGLFDLILIDKNDGTTAQLSDISSTSDMTFIVSTQMNDSVRCAELLARMLTEGNVDVGSVKLLLNSYYTDLRSVGYFTGLDEILNITGLPLIGIIPFSDKLHATQTHAYSTHDPDLCAAYENVCRRILGEEIKLLDFLPTRNRRKLLNN